MSEKVRVQDNFLIHMLKLKVERETRLERYEVQSEARAGKYFAGRTRHVQSVGFINI